MGGVCLGRLAAPAPPAPSAPPAPRPIVVMRGPEGMRVPVPDDATVDDLLRATRRAGLPARALTFCYAPMPPGARLADLGMCDDAEFGVAPCHHWRLQLERRSTYVLHCQDCDAWNDVNPRIFIGVEPRPVGDRRGKDEMAASLIVSRDHSREALGMLDAWAGARTQDAVAACRHPLAWRYTTTTMTCAKCRATCSRVYHRQA
jgi:hypothetical protein